jgi:NADH-quinone oxidoreductase subunit N
MDQVLMNFDWKGMAPEIVIVLAAALLTVLDLLIKDSVPRKWFGWLGFAATVAAGVLAVSQYGRPPREILGGAYRIDSYSVAFKEIILLGTALVFLSSFLFGKKELENREGEYHWLLLTGALGGMIMASSADLITLFVGLELLSLSSYILVGVQKQEGLSNEAAWKYMVLGGVSSAFILYGMSFLYGLSGSTQLFIVKQKIVDAINSGYQPIILLSLFLMMVGFGFKIAVAPFHMWTPDVYQGAPTPVTVFLAVVSKTAAFAMVLRVLLIAFYPLFSTEDGNIVVWLLLILAAASMVLGNAIALRQTDAKRVMAYSSIAQAGYLLVPLAALGFLLVPSMLFYSLAYLFMTAGAFTVVEWVTREAGTTDIRAFAGLSRRSPALALAMTVFLLSLAGIPVTAGFVGKLYLLVNAISGMQFWLAGVMVVTTVVSYWYYFEFIRQMYFRHPVGEATRRVPWPVWAVVILCLAGTLGLALFPDSVMHQLGKVDWSTAFLMVEK